MSKGKGQQVMEHILFPLEFQSPDGKDALQTAQKWFQLKFNHLANVISSIHVVTAAIYIMSEIPFCSCNFDMGIPYTPIFLSESVVHKVTNSRFQQISIDHVGLRCKVLKNQMSGLT